MYDRFQIIALDIKTLITLFRSSPFRGYPRNLPEDMSGCRSKLTNNCSIGTSGDSIRSLDFSPKLKFHLKTCYTTRLILVGLSIPNSFEICDWVSQNLLQSRIAYNRILCNLEKPIPETFPIFDRISQNPL